jgi:hypothetical protein
MSRRVLNAMLEDVLDAIKTQSAWRLNLRMQAAQKSLTVDPTPPGQLARKHSLGRPLLRDLEQFLRPTGSDEIRDVVQAEADGEDGEEGSNGDSPPGTVSKNGTDAAVRRACIRTNVRHVFCCEHDVNGYAATRAAGT